jgi:thiamine phosphate synthase YjbQ (UPF0047 family)
VGFLSSLFRGESPIDSLRLDDLKITEIQLNKKVDDLHAEVRRIDEEVSRNYDLAKAAPSESEQVSYARRIKTLLQKKEMKLSAQAQIEKELRAVSNIIILKDREKDLPADILKKLKKIDPDQMEKYLISHKLDTMSDDAQLNSIIDMTSSTMEVGVEPEDDISDILDTIRAGKEDAINTSPELSKVKKNELE